MDRFIQTSNDNLVYIVFGLIALCVLLLAMIAFLTYMVVRVNKRADRFFGRKSEKRSLETMLDQYQQQVDTVTLKYDDVLSLIDNLNERMRFCVQKVSIVRYNPFDGMGGDLSFSLALLDERNNGVILTTIMGRDASYTYSKPIVAAKSTYNLSDEELKAIEMALEGNKLVAYFHD